MMRAAEGASRWWCGPWPRRAAGRCGRRRRAAQCWPWRAAGPARTPLALGERPSPGRYGHCCLEEEHDGEVAAVRSTRERGGAEAAWQVDARASLQQFPRHLQVAVACGGVQQTEGHGPPVFRCSRVERVDRPSLAQPLDHPRQLALPCRVEDLDGQRGGRAHPGLSVRWGGRLGGGRLWRRCVLPGELRSGRLALDLGPLRCGAAVYVDQLGGPGE
eukprot:scaffold4324_cov57-Phaeocystis_antarctica.AAC.5